jgi:hypothetical protein
VAAVGGYCRCWVDWVAEDGAEAGAEADLVGAAGVAAVPAAEDSAGSEAAAAAAAAPPAVGERAS